MEMLQEVIAPWAEQVPDAPADMTASDLARLPDDGWIHELVEGGLIRMPLPGARHGDIASDLNAAMRLFVKAHGLGRVFGNDSGFQINPVGGPHTVLGAGAAFVRADRLPPQDDPVWDGYLPLAPDLVVEVASPSQYRPGLARKAQRWLRAGTRLVWVVWSGERQVDVWRPGHARPVATISQGENLDGLDVLPGFVYAIADLFA